MAFVLKGQGLHTFLNELTVPDGSMEVADNIVIDEDDVVESRRGFAKYGDTLPEQYGDVKQLLLYKDRILRHYEDILEYDDGSGIFKMFYGYFTELEKGLRIKYVESNGNLYFTSTDGIKKISAKTSAEFTEDEGFITNAGGLKALDFDVELDGTLGFLEPNHQVAYRVVWGTKDANGNLIIGSPSNRTIADNVTINDVNVKVSVQVPKDATDQYFVQLFRTASIESTTGEDLAGDEMNLVDERPYDGVSNPFIFVDETLNEFRDSGVPLYTNPISGEGIAQANDRPPVAKDLALFRGSLFYANTRTYHRREVNLLAHGGLVGYKFIIGSKNVVRQYTFVDTGVSENTAEGANIRIDISGSFSQNIDYIARELVRFINTDSDSEVNAYYESTDVTLPGLFLLEGKDFQDITFYLAVNDEILKNKFNPEMPVIETPTTTNIVNSSVFSNNETAQNRIYYSKIDQPESVPILNYLNVGPKDKAIRRIMALRDSLFVLKDDGVYTVTGYSAPNFSVKLLDPSTQILAPDSAAILNNKIYCLTSQGVVAITDTVQIVSRSIENLIKNVTMPDFDYKYTSFGVAYENDRAYLLWLPTLKGDKVATQAYRYNMFTNTWTRWVKSNTCGVVNSSDNKLYLGSGIHRDIEQERKNNDRTDYADRNFDVFLVSGVNIIEDEILVGSVTGISKGDAVYQKQYVTISFFNRLLKKLDLDMGLTQSLANGGVGFYNSLKIEIGSTLRSYLQNLDTMLQNDATIGTYTPVTFSADFQTMQVELNNIIDQLNGELTGTILKNYRLSVGDTYYEAVILSINTFQNRIQVSSMIPILQGSENLLEIYKSIHTKIVWCPTHFGLPNKTKQIRDATILFDQNNFYKAVVAYMSDLSRDFEEIEFSGRGIGVWGLVPWGEFTWGGEGSDAPFRTLIPRSKQRCRYITCMFKHIVARERFRLLGMSFEPREISERAYR